MTRDPYAWIDPFAFEDAKERLAYEAELKRLHPLMVAKTYVGLPIVERPEMPPGWIKFVPTHRAAPSIYGRAANGVPRRSFMDWVGDVLGCV